MSRDRGPGALVSFWVQITGHFVGADRRRVHATKARLAKTRRKTYDAVCGARVTPVAFPVVGGGHITTPWPPYAADAKEWGYERCPECLTAVPGKPRRLNLTPKENADV